MQYIKRIYQFFYQWEYRPAWLFRLPLYGFRAFFAIRAKHPFFFSAVNPAIPGGFMKETKTSTYTMLPFTHRPKSFQVQLPCDIRTISVMIEDCGLSYPLILKPDGDSVRGDSVYYITNVLALEQFYNQCSPGLYVLQEYVIGEEYSIHYYRYPTSSNGTIVGITKKIYPYVIGDGISNVETLLQRHDRYRRYIKLFREIYHVDMSIIIPKNEYYQIATIGNHAKGCMFLDWSTHISPKLITYIDMLFSETSGVYLYRLDIKALHWDDVVEGNFIVLEVNAGVFAEPTYVYDPSYKLRTGYVQFYTIWYQAYKIATYNHIIKKVPYLSRQQGVQYVIDFFKK